MHSQRWTLWPVDRLKFIYQTKYCYRNIELISRRISMNAMKMKWIKEKTKSKKKRECNQISTLTLSLASCTYCRVSGRVLSKRLTMCQSPLNWTEQFSFRNSVHFVRRRVEESHQRQSETHRRLSACMSRVLQLYRVTESYANSCWFFFVCFLSFICAKHSAVLFP